MKKLKINFCDFWSHFDNNDNYFMSLLSKKFDVEISDNPEYLIYSCYGTNHLNYDCFRIFYNAENQRTNWNACDYSLSFDYLEDHRHYRLPNWFLYFNINELKKSKPSFDEDYNLRSGFCNMVVSNHNAKKRINFFHLLSEYKKVDSGGRYLNNIGSPVKNKLDFIKNYKFTLAFENSSYPGYTTEKLVEPMVVGSIPIYWGNPQVGKDFNTKSFLNFHDYGSDQRLIDQIIKLDTDSELLKEMYNEPWLKNNILPDFASENSVLKAFLHFFKDSLKKKPVAQTNRKLIYNFQIFLRNVDFILDSKLKYRKRFR